MYRSSPLGIGKLRGARIRDNAVRNDTNGVGNLEEGSRVTIRDEYAGTPVAKPSQDRHAMLQIVTGKSQKRLVDHEKLRLLEPGLGESEKQPIGPVHFRRPFVEQRGQAQLLQAAEDRAGYPCFPVS